MPIMSFKQWMQLQGGKVQHLVRFAPMDTIKQQREEQTVNSNDLERLAAQQLRQYNKAPMSVRSNFLALAVESAVQATQVQQQEECEMATAVFNAMHTTMDTYGLVAGEYDALDPNSASTNGQQLQELMENRVNDWLHEQVHYHMAMVLSSVRAAIARLLIKAWHNA